MQKHKLPKFKNDAEEDLFWQSHDSTEYIDWSNAKRASFPNLKPSTVTISLRLPESLLNQIKIIANKRDIPYQSLMKELLNKQVQKEQLPFVPLKFSSTPRAYKQPTNVSKKHLQVRDSGASIYTTEPVQGRDLSMKKAKRKSKKKLRHDSHLST